jgi:methylated-DNA-protein-cysteine methyltransferase related protein
MSNRYEQIYSIVRQIPPGRVATYGQIARLAGLSRHARQVGYALHALADGHDVPWQRVINAKGEISQRANPVFVSIQRELLEREGITFNQAGRISLAQYQWHANGD